MDRASTWVFGLVMVVASARAQGQGDRPLLRALNALDQGQEEQALAVLEEPLSSQTTGSDWADARFAAARATLSLGDAERALDYLNGLESYLPEVADYVVSLRARAYRQTGAWTEALLVWQHLIRQFPASPLVTDAYLGVADAFLALDRLPEAKNAYLAALRRLPQNPTAALARFNVAHIDETLGRISEAASGYTFLGYHRATDSIGDLARERLAALVAAGRTPAPSHRTLLARVDRLITGRRLEQARVAVDELRATAITAEQQEATDFRQAQLAYYERDFAKATPALRALVEAHPGLRGLTYQSWLGRSQSAAGEIDAAIVTYKDLADRYPTRREARDALFKAAWLCFNGRQYDRALKLFAEFLTRYPRDRHADEAVWYSAWNSYRMGDLPTALQLIAKLKASYPGSELRQRALYWQGRFLSQIGRVDDAVTSYTAAVDAEPLSYYALLARQRLRDFGAGPQLSATVGPLFASLQRRPSSDGEMSDVPNEQLEPLEPSTEELPESGGYIPAPATELPWGASVIDWTGVEGQRALKLIRLGLRQPAANLIATLPDLPGQEPAAATYARARLYYALGAFDRAYRLASIAFAGALKGEPRGRSRAFFHLAYPAAHQGLVEQAASEFNASPWLILAVMRQESAFRPDVRSPMNARGLMQILPSTGERIADALEVEPFTSEMLNNPEVSVRFGAWYLAQLSTKFRGHPILTVSAYNAGPTVVAQWVATSAGALTDEFVEEIPFRETRGYVRRVISNLAVYTSLYGGAPVEIPERLPTSSLAEPSF